MNHMNRPTLLSHSLLPRRHSPWSRVRYRGTNREWVFLMGVDRKAFGMLLPAFSALYEKYTLTGGLMKKKRAHTKSRALDAVSCLALVLHWMTSTADAKYLCLIFAIPPTLFYRYKNFGLVLLRRVLSKRKDCAVVWPSEEKMRKFAGLCEVKEPRLTGMFGTVDGVNLKIFNPSDPLIQNANYNGWISVTCCSNLVVFGFDGTVIMFIGNCPGSWADSMLACRGLYQKLKETCHVVDGVQMRTGAESAFPKK